MFVGTIGYQETTVDAFLASLAGAGIELLVDVRAVAASRRPGFSKRQLAAGVSTIAIDYLHLRDLGTPAAGRQAARAGRVAEMQRIYGAHLETSEARFALGELAGIVRGGARVCLLCFERDAAHCHRTMVVQQLVQDLSPERGRDLGMPARGRDLGMEVRHLVP